jgi:hypothetical protein
MVHPLLLPSVLIHNPLSFTPTPGLLPRDPYAWIPQQVHVPALSFTLQFTLSASVPSPITCVERVERDTHQVFLAPMPPGGVPSVRYESSGLVDSKTECLVRFRVKELFLS